MTLYRFESLKSRDVHERDSSKVQDQAVDAHFWNPKVIENLGIPINQQRKVLEVSGQTQFLLFCGRFISCLNE